MKNVGIQLSSDELLKLKGGSASCYRCDCGDEDYVYIEQDEFEDYGTHCIGGDPLGTCHLYDGVQCQFGAF